MAIVQVGSATFEVVVGQTFAGNLMLEISGQCATWQRGDQVITRCVGDPAK